MQFSHTYNGNTSKFGKIAIVAAIHLLVGTALINSMNIRTFITSPTPPDITVLPSKPVEPPPVTPQKFEPQQQQTRIFVPTVDTIPVTPVEPTVTGTTSVPDPGPAKVVAGGPVAPPVPVPVTPPKPVTRSAVLADANSCVKPEYPGKAARNGDTGTVVLSLLVDASGMVTNSRVDRSSGHRDLDRAAQGALSMCKFKPAMENGVPQQGWAQISYVWTLD